MAPPRLEARDVAAGYGQVPIVEHVDLRVGGSEMVAIVGPNGAGKSTFLKSVMGITRIFAGSVVFDGREVVGSSTDEIARLGVGYIPQGNAIFPSLTVRENLELGAYQKPRATAVRIQEVLELLPELSEKLKRRAGILSGGERTMLGIGRALMAKPTLLLLDEPSSGLAPRIVATLWGYLQRLRSAGIPMLIVEQRTNDILEIADRGYVLVNGHVALEAPARKLLKEVDLAQVFLQATPKNGSAAAHPRGGNSVLPSQRHEGGETT